MPFPNLLIVGATKAGTTSVFRYLADHPAVCASSQKEINFFYRFRDAEMDDRLRDKYQGYFSHCSTQQQIRLEASPVYLSGGSWIAAKINQSMPEAKLVFILRDPVARYLSHFKFWLAKTDNVPPGVSIGDAIAQGVRDDIELGERGRDEDWPSRAVQLVRAGCYAKALTGYLEVLPKERICVLFFEDLAKDPRGFMRRLCDFAQIDGALYDDYAFSVENKTRIVKHKGLHRLTIGANNLLQPILNRVPGVRKAIRGVYYFLNRESADTSAQISPADLAPLAEFYSEENRALRRLLEQTYPGLPLTEWLDRQ